MVVINHVYDDSKESAYLGHYSTSWLHDVSSSVLLCSRTKPSQAGVAECRWFPVNAFWPSVSREPFAVTPLRTLRPDMIEPGWGHRSS